MTTYNVTIDLNAPCTACGKLGRVVENAAGLCLTCIEEALGDAVPATGRLQLDRTQRPEGRGLAGSLFDLILRTESARDQKFHSLPLQHGLFVEIGLGEFFNLRMYRRDCTPSSREWQTVVDYLPAAYQPAQAVQPRDFKHTSRDHLMRWYLEAHWPIKQT